MGKLLEYLRKSRKHKALYRVLYSVACVVFFVTTYALIYPAITMDKDAVCGHEVHEHTEDCYTSVLVCGLEASEGHQHDDSCWQTESILTCDVLVHAHDEEFCYDEEGNLICERAEHVHSEDCYTEERTLICGQEESEGHQHTEDCYEKRLTCGLEAHTHSASCYQSVLEETIEVLTGQSGTDDSGAGDGGEYADSGEAGSGSQGDSQGEEAGNYEGNAFDGGYASEGDAADAAGATDEEGLDESVEDPSMENAEGGMLPAAPIVVDQMLTQRTSLWVLTEENIWVPVNEETRISPDTAVMLYLAFTLPQGSLTSSNLQSEYILPEGLEVSPESALFNNADENGWNQIVLGERLPGEIAAGDEYLLGKYNLSRKARLSTAVGAGAEAASAEAGATGAGAEEASINEGAADNNSVEEVPGGDVPEAGISETQDDIQGSGDGRSSGIRVLALDWSEFAVALNAEGEVRGWMSLCLRGSDLVTGEDGTGEIVFARYEDHDQDVKVRFTKAMEAAEEASAGEGAEGDETADGTAEGDEIIEGAVEGDGAAEGNDASDEGRKARVTYSSPKNIPHRYLPPPPARWRSRSMRRQKPSRPARPWKWPMLSTKIPWKRSKMSSKKPIPRWKSPPCRLWTSHSTTPKAWRSNPGSRCASPCARW